MREKVSCFINAIVIVDYFKNRCTKNTLVEEHNWKWSRNVENYTIENDLSLTSVYIFM